MNIFKEKPADNKNSLMEMAQQKGAEQFSRTILNDALRDDRDSTRIDLNNLEELISKIIDKQHKKYFSEIDRDQILIRGLEDIILKKSRGEFNPDFRKRLVQDEHRYLDYNQIEDRYLDLLGTEIINESNGDSQKFYELLSRKFLELKRKGLIFDEEKVKSKTDRWAKKIVKEPVVNE